MTEQAASATASGDGGTYAPAPIPDPVVGEGEFVFAAIGLDHGHIYGMCQGLIGAGATLRWVHDPDPAKVEAFVQRFPGVRAARSEAEVFEDPDVRLVAGAAVTSERCALGIRAMEAGKDYFTDKAPLTTLEQLADARDAVARTGRKYAVYYSERVHVETAVFAGQLIEQGAIGKVVQVVGFGPHRLNAPSRPEWFFQKEKYGGILCDIGSHNVDQILHYTGATDATVSLSQIANYANPEHPELDDFGDANLVTNTGATGYFRCDWFTPDGLQTWGDGRMFILGTEGFIEQRKYMNIGTQDGPGHLFLANGEQETHFEVAGKVGYPYFGQLVLDCLERTENAMTQDHAFKAIEIAITAQNEARDLTPGGRGTT
ncbi:Gfo/Idh/MocA family protein [Georgenia alba]|uniref:Gfo/Idh/MocA family protein n=1 Tax=Georgenia alba TaxID=2233858 RepID=A0ABW2Q8I5_9MICO